MLIWPTSVQAWYRLLQGASAYHETLSIVRLNFVGSCHNLRLIFVRTQEEKDATLDLSCFDD